jgi:hypothetical protein
VPLLLPLLQVLPRGGESVLSIGRLFGRIIQKGQNKKVERPDKSAAKFWPILNKKGLVSLLLSSLILGKFKKYYFPFHTDKYSDFLMPNSFKKMEITGDQTFFLSRRIYLLDWSMATLWGVRFSSSLGNLATICKLASGVNDTPVANNRNSIRLLRP